MKTILAVTALAIAACGVSEALAHHSFAAEFDADKPVKLTGTVTKVQWRNPHTYFYVDVSDDKGNVNNWALELGSPNGLSRRGWTRDTLPPGTKVTVQGFMSKDGALRANARDITFPDGKKMFVGSSGTGAPDERPEQ